MVPPKSELPSACEQSSAVVCCILQFKRRCYPGASGPLPAHRDLSALHSGYILSSNLSSMQTRNLSSAGGCTVLSLPLPPWKQSMAAVAAIVQTVVAGAHRTATVVTTRFPASTCSPLPAFLGKSLRGAVGGQNIHRFGSVSDHLPNTHAPGSSAVSHPVP